ncbi:unnamed protein product [Cunninghamella blakesleeana]
MYSNNNNSNNTSTSIPFVHYYCDCPSLKSHDQTLVKKNPMLLDDNSSNGNLSTSSSTFLLSPSNSTPFDCVMKIQLLQLEDIYYHLKQLIIYTLCQDSIFVKTVMKFNVLIVFKMK